VKTYARTSNDLDRVYAFIDEELDRGAQAYVVFPVIEESEKLNVKALTIGYEAMSERFPNRRMAMLHGRMSAAEKEETMALFKSGELDMLVATTVIEVGIDVPNASIMLIHDADRFGLSQLHQLRGRVGRGARKSYCIVVSDKEKERLELFARTSSGFDVAEHDLGLRGPGEFLGTKQSGVPRFRFGNIVRDHKLMEQAKAVAIEEVVERDVAAADELVRSLIGIAVAAGERD
jgi:ATP-dependent DNA helicase RecG